jgi:uncharacterized membrane protein
LPEGAFLNQRGLLFPTPNKINSDGYKIFLLWNNFKSEQIIVPYTNFKNQTFWGFFILGIILIGITLAYYLHIKKYRKKIDKLKSSKKKNKNKKIKEITKNLLKEEKLIVEYLFNKQGKESWSKNISKDLGINKVKLTRKLKKLKEKGLIKKIPYGNENKICLKKT